MSQTTMADRRPTVKRKASERPQAPLNERYLLDVNGACDYLSIGKTTLKEYVAAGDIKTLPLKGRDQRYLRSELEAFVERLQRGETFYQRKVAS